MRLRSAGLWVLLIVVGVIGCRGNDSNRADSARALPPVFPSAAVNTGWNPEAGPLMIVSSGSSDTVGVVLPAATDSKLKALGNITTAVAGLTIAMFAPGGT